VIKISEIAFVETNINGKKKIIATGDYKYCRIKAGNALKKKKDAKVMLYTQTPKSKHKYGVSLSSRTPDGIVLNQIY